MKTLLSILLFFTCFSAFSQNPISTPRIRMPDRSGVDTTTIVNTGQIVFDADDDKFRFNDGTGWFSFLKEGATLPYWPLSGSATLTGNTTINGDFNIVFGPLGDPINVFQTRAESQIALQVRTPISDSFSLIGLSGTAATLTFSHDINGANTFRARLQGLEFITRDVTRMVINEYGKITATSDTIIFENQLPVLDTAAWVLVREHSSGEIKRRSASSIASSGAFWPLSGTATATGDIAIDGGGQSLELEFDSLNFTAPVVTYTNKIVPAPTVLSQVLWADNTVIASESPLTSLIDKDVFGVEDAVATITFTIHAISDDGSVAYSAKKEATFRKDGSANPVAVGTTTTIFEKEDVAGTDTSITTSGANIRLSITTPANTALHWAAYATVMMTKYL